MKTKTLFIVCCFLITNLCAQEITTIAATIIDEQTKESVEFVNIGFEDKGIGTVSNAKGNFSLTFNSDAIEDAQHLQISSIGYETRKIPLNQLSKLTSYKYIIHLTPKEYNLDEVLVVNEKREFDRLGSAVYAKERIGYWMNKKALGGEIATQVKVNKKNTQLHSLSFNILENKGDSLLVRVKVYDYHRGFPGKNLVTKNIYHTITKKNGEETIPLKQYNIIAHEDIIVSLELVEIYGDAIYFSVSASPYKGVSYTREISLDGWKAYRDVGISFNLISSYPSKSEEKNITNRQKPEILDLYWDSSLPLKKRNTEEELKLLTKYLRHLGKAQIRAVKFSNGRFNEKKFEIEKGKSKELIAFLEDTHYLGATDFTDVLKTNTANSNAALVFTNGKSLYGELQTALTIPVFCINSSAEANDYQLQLTSYLSGGHYINLTKVQPKNALAFLQYDIQDTYTYDQKQNIDKSGYLYGVVYNENGVPLQGATVSIKNSFTEVKTGPNGRYTIDATPGEILSIEAFGMYRKDTLVGELKKLHIPMRTNRELLDEVYLEAKTISEEIGDELIETPFGKRKNASIGFSTNKTITSEQITKTKTELSQILNFGTGIEAVPQDTPGEFKYRFRKFKHASFLLDTYAAVVVDDVVYDQNIPGIKVPEINPQNIESIALLLSASATIRYGSAAAFGAIVIKTKMNTSQTINKDVEFINTALATNNNYDEQLVTLEVSEIQNTPSVYINELKTANTFEEAKKLYSKQLKMFGGNIPFYIKTALYFEKWDTNYSESILSNIAALAPTNVKALKALAYQYEEKDNMVAASKIFEHIVNLAPNEVQSYLDLASSYRQSNRIETAFALYTQILYNSIPNVSAAEVQDQVINELQHLIANHKSKLDFKQLPDELLKVHFKQDIRIVFDWNDAATEFELQFVSPQNKYFTFAHTAFDNRPLLAKEIEDGFTSKEFILDNAEPGKWLINFNYLGEQEEKNPTYLKYTLYRNYGLPTETKEIKVVNLSEYNKKITLDSFQL